MIGNKMMEEEIRIAIKILVGALTIYFKEPEICRKGLQ